MNKKNKFYYSGKTGIARTEAFEKKGLAEYSINIGNICEFGCTFCYVPSVTSKQKVVRDIIDQGYKLNEFCSYRYKTNVLSCVNSDIKKIRFDDNRTVFLCTTCDPCATMDHADTSIKIIKLIVDQSNLQVRVLSKSILLKEIAKELSPYRDRVVYSLSTGTTLETISRAIEESASNILARIQTLHWLQDNNYRTYGMICPVIPSEVNNAKQLLDQIRPELCEDVWVEAVNVRGKSLVNTYNKLTATGLEEHAEELKRVMGNRSNWIEYSKKLFFGFQGEMRLRGLLNKLHFLQYVSKYDRAFFEGQPGAVCL